MTDCNICWGTGFVKGWGAACTAGCGHKDVQENVKEIATESNYALSASSPDGALHIKWLNDLVFIWDQAVKVVLSLDRLNKRIEYGTSRVRISGPPRYGANDVFYYLIQSHPAFPAGLLYRCKQHRPFVRDTLTTIFAHYFSKPGTTP